MKRLAIAIAAALTAAAPAAFADHDTYRGYDSRDNAYRSDDGTYRYDSRADNRDYRGERARVIETRAVGDVATGQRQECWNPRAGHYEEVRDPDHGDKRNVAGTVIGGILGGVLGHQVGSGNGNTAATVGGAALGAYAGNRVEKNRNDNGQDDLDRSRCRVVADSSATGNVQAYDVRYTWQGREYVARMDHDPGRFVQLGRDVNADGTPYAEVADSGYSYSRR